MLRGGGRSDAVSKPVQLHMKISIPIIVFPGEGGEGRDPSPGGTTY